ncbi:MAG: HlyC/CorC family transporter [Bordetella sp.]
MSDLPIWAQALALLGLLLASAFFSMSETSLMAVNRYRMRHLAGKGRRSAKQVLKLLSHTNQLLATILIGNNIVNAALTALITAFAIQAFGNNDEVLAIATGIAAALLIVFAEIIPKVVAANRPETIAMGASFGLGPLVWITRPLVAVVNRLVSFLLNLLRLKSQNDKGSGLTTEELRSAVLESSGFIPSQHRKILLNLFDLEDLRVDDVMVPRGRIEALDLEDDETSLIDQISTCFHNKLPVYRGELNQVIGILHVRKALALVAKEEGFRKEMIEQAVQPAYFVPSGTQLYTQMQFFQGKRQRLAIVVDEYGEVEGLVTLQDIVEELVGEFSTQGPRVRRTLQWEDDGTAVVDGMSSLRELNRGLGLSLPLDSAKTLNGLILEALQDIPEANVSLKVGHVPLEILQVQGRVIRRVKIQRPLVESSKESADEEEGDSQHAEKSEHA